jgi:homogentisate 1,2-dioxygenase
MPQLTYQSGFGNEFATEAQPGGLPVGQNSPQKHPLGLYTEQVSGSAFTAPRGQNRRTWMYRIRPSVVHEPYQPFAKQTLLRSGPFDEEPTPPNQMRWDPLPFPAAPTDFVEGIVTIGGNGSPDAHDGVGVHIYAATRSMTDRFFYSADGEMLILPQEGGVRFSTECGILEAKPGELVVIPRGIKFRVELLEKRLAAISARTMASLFACPTSAPSEPMDWRTRATFLLRWPPLTIAKANLRSSRSSSADSGRRRSIIRRSTWLRGTETMRPTSTTWRASTASTP